MNIRSLGIAAALSLVSAAAFAQSGTNVAPGQGVGAIVPNTFANNTDPNGFGDSSLNPAVVAAGTTQATATLIVAKNNVITVCAAGAGVILPSITRYTAVLLMNRSGNTCLVYPTLAATAESAPGTAGAVNAGITMASNVDVIFKPVSATAWNQ